MTDISTSICGLTECIGKPMCPMCVQMNKKPAAAADPERDDFLLGICVALQCVTASDDGVLWRDIVTTAGVDQLLRFATFVEPDEWELAGFSRYAMSELRRAKPRKCVPPLKRRS